jgi:predicted dehydrogenase
MICRRDRIQGEVQAKRLGVPFVGDCRRVLEDPGVDAVVLVLPPDQHVRLVPEALDAGKGVLVEKPLAPDAAGARSLVEAARRSGQVAMVAQTLRFNTVVRAIRERREALGELRVISLSQRFEPSTRTWLDDPVAGGILRNTGVHSFDLVRHLTGLEAEEALCFTHRVRTKQTEDAFGAVLKLAGGSLGVVENNRATAGRNGRIELVGEKGQLCGDHVHGLLVEIQGSSARSIPLPPMVPTVRECLAAFAAALHGRTPVPIPLEEGLRAVEIVDACRESAEMKMPRRVAGH